MSEARDLITWTLGTIVSLSVVTGLVVRFILMPYLREHLVKPMGAVRHHVENSHNLNLRDDLDAKFDGLASQIGSLGTEVRDLKMQHQVEARMFEGHLEWSERWVALAERDVDALRAEIRRHHPEGN